MYFVAIFDKEVIIRKDNEMLSTADFEKIKFEQADRVIKNKENVNMIKKCDIERAILKQEKKVEKQKKIGFESVG